MRRDDFIAMFQLLLWVCGLLLSVWAPILIVAVAGVSGAWLVCAVPASLVCGAAYLAWSAH